MGKAASRVEAPKVIGGGKNPQLVTEWEKSVMDRLGNRCCSCGGDERLRVRMVVPEEAGGLKKVSNGVVICRTCEMAAESIPNPGFKAETYVVCIWMSQRLRKRIDKLLAPKNTFKSWSSLSRYLISKYVEDEDRFDDLEQYQDGDSETKVTIRVDKTIYSKFTALLRQRGITVTDALKGLYMMYASGAGSAVNGRRK